MCQILFLTTISIQIDLLSERPEISHSSMVAQNLEVDVLEKVMCCYCKPRSLSAFRAYAWRTTIANQYNRTICISLHHATKHEIEVYL